MTGPADVPGQAIPHGKTGKVRVPDFPQTLLAFRVWRVGQRRLTLYSLNVPQSKAAWVASLLASPGGSWPYDHPLAATCGRGSQHGEDDPVPAKACRCGIYGARDLDVISRYLDRDAPVIGVVELGGRVVAAEHGYRAALGRVAAILLVDPLLTLDHAALRRLAGAYRVPAIRPHSEIPEDYRTEVTATSALAAEAEQFLRREAGS